MVDKSFFCGLYGHDGQYGHDGHDGHCKQKETVMHFNFALGKYI